MKLLVEEKQCTCCEEDLPIDEFDWANKKRSYRRSDCKKCCLLKFRKRKETNREYYKEQSRIVNLKYLYGIDIEGWNKLYTEQDGKCPICYSTVSINSNIDHDHTCCKGNKSCGNCVRGILCGGCNRALGLLRDDVDTLQRAINYLGKTNASSGIK